MGQRTLPHVEEGGAHVEVVARHVVKSGAKQGLRLNAEQRIGLQRDANGLTGLEKAIVDDAHPSQVVVDRVIPVFFQTHPACRHRDRTFRHIQRIELNLRRTLGLETTFDPESVQRWDLLGCRLGAVVQRLKHEGFDQRISLRFRHVFFRGKLHDFRFQIGSKGFHRGQENPTVLAVDGSTTHCSVVHIVEDPILVWHAVDVDAVHAQHLNEQPPFKGFSWDVVEVHSRIGVVVPNVQSEILVADPEGAHRIDVLHHRPPERRLVSVVELDLRD